MFKSVGATEMIQTGHKTFFFFYVLRSRSRIHWLTCDFSDRADSHLEHLFRVQRGVVRGGRGCFCQAVTLVVHVRKDAGDSQLLKPVGTLKHPTHWTWSRDQSTLMEENRSLTSLEVNPGTSLATLSQLIGWGTPHRDPKTMSKTRTLLS